ncbi:MAG: hypothetical protein K2X81_09885, partial [Candidatus Obscuribacterales bacterium]|nr:hypothetical protein [Candidatus Obscuribacterales bacterium]
IFEANFMICPVRLRDASGHRQDRVWRKIHLEKVTQKARSYASHRYVMQRVERSILMAQPAAGCCD